LGVAQLNDVGQILPRPTLVAMATTFGEFDRKLALTAASKGAVLFYQWEEEPRKTIKEVDR